MSFEKPSVIGTVPPYVSATDGIVEMTVDALGMWILERLKSKLPSLKTKNGSEVIYYSWYYDQKPGNPQSLLKSPAVAIDIMLTSELRLGDIIGDGIGGFVPGGVRTARISVAIIANSARYASSLDALIAQQMDLMSGDIDSPVMYCQRTSYADDRGFTGSERFLANTLWQNMNETVFVRMSTFFMGLVEQFRTGLPELDDSWTGVSGSSATETTVDDIVISGYPTAHRSLRITFTPNIP
jgi:hypothetical protein